MADRLKCFFCRQLVDGYVDGLRRHLKVHENLNHFRKELVHYTCTSKGCRMSYRKFANLRQHILMKHPPTSREQQPEHSRYLRVDVQPTSLENAGDTAAPNTGGAKPVEIEPFDASIESLRKFASVAVCKLRSDVSFTETKITQIVEFCESVVDQINMFVSQRLDAFVTSSKLKLTTEEIVQLKNDIAVDDLFKDVKGSGRQDKFLEKMVGSIPAPRPIMLRSREVKRFQNGQEQIVKVIHQTTL